jgi:hypothetical protein
MPVRDSSRSETARRPVSRPLSTPDESTQVPLTDEGTDGRAVRDTHVAHQILVLGRDELWRQETLGERGVLNSREVVPAVRMSLLAQA